MASPIFHSLMAIGSATIHKKALGIMIKRYIVRSPRSPRPLVQQRASLNVVLIARRNSVGPFFQYQLYLRTSWHVRVERPFLSSRFIASPPSRAYDSISI
ncbi:hypothetical protein WG66_010425 [Moniliophthora roreri]|nr:hypothetical protein WG66_010425 [Moniliophthora roreri]